VVGLVAGAHRHLRDNDSWRGGGTHREWRPAGLDRFVELIWESAGHHHRDLDRHFPHGRIELLLNLGGERST
jgi:hypothetical protein